MKLFVVSDVHGFFSTMIEALENAGFDKNNPNHMLISCGDNFDRGYEPREMKEYLLCLQNKVLVLGNHEDLIKDAVCYGYHSYDSHNGTLETIFNLASKYLGDNDMNMQNRFAASCEAIRPEILDFCGQCVNYYETKKYIFVHGFIPEVEDWRNASWGDWEESRWINGIEKAINNENKTGKTIVFGHWGTYEYNEKLPNGKNNYGPFKKNNCIGLDATTVFSNKVNVLVIEDDLL